MNQISELILSETTPYLNHFDDGISVAVVRFAVDSIMQHYDERLKDVLVRQYFTILFLAHHVRLKHPCSHNDVLQP